MVRVSIARILVCGLATAMPAQVYGQTQGVNGNIEGTVRDASEAVLPGVPVTVLECKRSALEIRA